MQPQKRKGVSPDDPLVRERIEKLKRFKRWVTSEVLPSIRKHGAYMTPETLESAVLNPDMLIKVATALKDEQEKRRVAEAEAKKKSALLAEAKPKVDFYDAISETSGNITVGNFAKVVSGKLGLGFGRTKMFKWMRDNDILDSNNIPYQRYMELGWFETYEILKYGHPCVVTSITGKGQQGLVKKLIAWKKKTGIKHA